MPAALDQNPTTASSSAPAITAWCWAAISPKCGLENSAGRPPAAIRRRARHRGGDGAGLLPQPAFDQSLPHQRDAVVQGPRPRRSRRIHHAALRVRPAASRRLGIDLRPRPRRDTGQRRALLEEGRADLPRLEPQGRGDHRQDIPARSGSPIRCRRPSARRCWKRATSAATSSLRRSGSRSTW